MTISKKLIFHIIAFIWIVFSVVFILYDVWSDFKNVQISNAYQQGRTDTINALIQQSKDCQTVPIYSGDTQIQIIDVSCLKTAEEK